MASATKAAAKGRRIHWLDNLRTIMVLLVVLYHVGGVYEAAGMWGWFWIVDDPATITWVGIVGILFDILIMPVIFFISGYLAPASLQGKTGWAFIKGKLERLMLPWAVAVFTLIPLYKVIFLYSRGLPQEHWSTYFHITNPNSQNWLWFLPVLFGFNALYLLVSKTGIRFPRIPIWAASVGATVLGFLYSYGIGGLLGFRSWTLTPVIDFENERLLVYLLAFSLGALCFRQKVFAREPQGKTLYTVVNSLAWIPITAHIFARLYPFFYPDGFAVTPLYRAVWWLTFHLSLLCLMYAMIETFRRYLNGTGIVWRALNRNTYGVYIIHVIAIGLFGTVLLNVALPAVVKYPLLFALTYLGSNLAVWAYRSVAQAIRSRRTTALAQATDPA